MTAEPQLPSKNPGIQQSFSETGFVAFLVLIRAFQGVVTPEKRFT